MNIQKPPRRAHNQNGRTNPLPQIETLRQYFTYDKETGGIYRHGMLQGSIADTSGITVQLTVYTKIDPDDRKPPNYFPLEKHHYKLLAHRVAYAMVKGRWPNVIHHKNFRNTDNRWENLQNVSQKANYRRAKTVERRTPLALKNGLWRVPIEQTTYADFENKDRASLFCFAVINWILSGSYKSQPDAERYRIDTMPRLKMDSARYATNMGPLPPKCSLKDAPKGETLTTRQIFQARQHEKALTLAFRIIGNHTEGGKMFITEGKFGDYLKWRELNVQIKTENVDPLTMTCQDAEQLIAKHLAKRKTTRKTQ